MPKPKPPPKVEIPNLMFFDNEPEPASASPAQTDSEHYAPGSEWAAGSVVVPVQVTGNGDVKRSIDFGQTEFDSLREVYARCGPFSAVTEYPALFGALLLDKLYFLVAESVSVGAELPHTGTISRVLATRWVAVPLPGVAPVKVSSTDRTRLYEFEEYAHKSGYYYSDYADLRLPFPFTRKPGGLSAVPDFQCDWTGSLRQPFRAASLRHACSVLIRGFVCERVNILRNGTKLHQLLLGRQNSINPGPRYHSRGLNAECGAGNDHYYEYIMWRASSRESVTYARHSILRGTIPVCWTTQTSMSLSEPAMVFSANRADILKGSDVYFANAVTQLQRLMLLDSNGTTVTNPKLRGVSLLRLNQPAAEGLLARYYLDAVRASEPRVRAMYPHSNLDLVHVDWLNIIKEYGIDMATSSYWEATIPFLCEGGNAEDAPMSVGIVRADGGVERLISQTRFLRINCADSLDRTNLGCFFVCLQMSIAMLSTLQVPFDAFANENPLPPLAPSDDEDDANFSYAAAFAPVSGAKNIVPAPFLNTWNEARDRKRLPPALARSLAEIYVHNGDCVAMLYTTSAAMHGNILRGICGMKAASHNAIIATQRKFENAFEDSNKYRNIELLLGRRLLTHFPSFSPVFLTRPVPHQLWGSALIAIGLPPGTKAEDIDIALRTGWDSGVLPWLRESGSSTPIESSALCFTVSLQQCESATDDCATLGTSPTTRSAPMMSTSTNQSSLATSDEIPTDGRPELARRERLAVIEVDPSLCTVVNVPVLMRQKGFLLLAGRNCILAPYAYPVQTDTDDTRSGGMKTSLKRGFKNFVRGLN